MVGETRNRTRIGKEETLGKDAYTGCMNCKNMKVEMLEGSHHIFLSCPYEDECIIMCDYPYFEAYMDE